MLKSGSVDPPVMLRSSSFIGSIGETRLPATASAMDLARGAYRVAASAGGVSCVQSIYAHRAGPVPEMGNRRVFLIGNNGVTRCIRALPLEFPPTSLTRKPCSAQK